MPSVEGSMREEYNFRSKSLCEDGEIRTSAARDDAKTVEAISAEASFGE